MLCAANAQRQKKTLRHIFGKYFFNNNLLYCKLCSGQMYAQRQKTAFSKNTSSMTKCFPEKCRSEDVCLWALVSHNIFF